MSADIFTRIPSQNCKNSVLIIGSKLYSDGYPRNREIIESLQELGWEIHWCALAYPKSFHKLNLVLRLTLIIAYTPLRWLYTLFYSLYLRTKLKPGYVYVPFPSHLDIPVAWLVARLNGAKLVADIFLSAYNTLIQDRELSSPQSVFSKIIYHLEKALLRLPHYRLIDTEEHKSLILRLYGNSIDQLDVVPIAIDEKVFTFLPPVATNKVIFWGTYIKLHGVDTIVQAASKIQSVEPQITFELIGTGQELGRAKALAHKLKADNIAFIETILPAEKLVERSRTAFCILGIFGVSDKSDCIFPYKAVQALALGGPLITAQTSASSRLLRHNYSAILVPAGNAEALGDAIRSLHSNRELGRKLASNGRKVFDRNFSREVIKLSLSKIFKFPAPHASPTPGP